MRVGAGVELKAEHFRQAAPQVVRKPLFDPADYMELARIGPRDRSSQRTAFDLLVSAAPDVVLDEDLITKLDADKSTMHSVISRLRRRLAQSPYSIQRDETERGYYLDKDPV